MEISNLEADGEQSFMGVEREPLLEEKGRRENGSRSRDSLWKLAVKSDMPPPESAEVER